MSKDLTVTYSGLSADEKRVIINDKRAVRLRHGCAITELRALDRTARELQDTCHKQAQRIAVLEQAARQPLTDKQIQDIWCSARIDANQHGPFWFAHAIERAVLEKFNG